MAALPKLVTERLQWGRGLSTAETQYCQHQWVNPRDCFNGAAVSQPRRPGVTNPALTEYYWLQWGRGLSTAETSLLRARLRAHGRCFNGAAVSQPRRQAMKMAGDARDELLQWGRGLSTAETSSLVVLRRSRRRLQWGRGLSTAETHRAHGKSIGGRDASMGPRSLNRGDVES